MSNAKVFQLPAFLQGKDPREPRMIDADPVRMEPDLEDLARGVERTRDALARAKQEHADAVKAFNDEQDKRGLRCLGP